MKLLTWNLNHRTRPKPIPDLVPEVIKALSPDLLVLTEYVRGPSHDSFLTCLFDLGLCFTLMSPEANGENSVLIAGRSNNATLVATTAKELARNPALNVRPQVKDDCG